MSMPAFGKYQSICAKNLCKKMRRAALWIKCGNDVNNKIVLNKRGKNEVHHHAE